MSKMNSNLTQERLRELLRYCWASGLWSWASPQSNRVSKGQVAGYLDKSNGYIKISIDGRNHYAHRLVMLYIYGEFSPEVDHKNRRRDDNSLDNLRAASRRLNSQNQRRREAGEMGAFWCERDKKWEAKVVLDGSVHRLGKYNTAAEANEAYVKKKRELHAYCTL